MDLNLALPYDEEYETQLQIEQNMLNIAKLTLDLQNSSPAKFKSEVENEACKDNVKVLSKYYKDTSEALAKKWQHFNEGKILKTHRKDDLIIPKDTKVHAVGFNIKDAIMILGHLTDEKSSQMRSFLDAMFQFGENLKLSHEDYKNIFAACFQGTLKQQFLMQKKDTFSAICTWFDTVYHRPDEFHTLDKQLKQFVRKSGEPIHIFLTRYELLAKKADSLLPNDQKFFTTKLHVQNLIELALQEPARTDYKKWKNRYFDGGFSTPLTECIRQAGIMEKYHNCIPNVDTPLYKDPTTAYANLNTHVELQSNVMTRTVQKNAQEPLLTLDNLSKPIRKKKRPALKSDIDPQRATSQVPSFYRDSLNKMNNPQRPPTRPNFQTNPKRPPFLTRNIHRGGSYRGNQRGRGQPPRNPMNRFQVPQIPNYQRGSGRGGFRRTGPPRGRLPYGANPRYNQRETAIPPQFFKQQQRSHLPYRNPTLVKPPSQPPGLYCLRCGVKKSSNKSPIINDHATRNCYLYPFCDTICPYCIQVSGIEAFHKMEHCLLKKRQQQSNMHQ